MHHQNLFVFDIETIPDTSVASRLAPTDATDEGELRAALEKYHLGITDGKNPFLRAPFHKIVAISFLEAEIQQDANKESYLLQELRSGGKVGASEKELLQGFFSHLQKKRARLISFNGRHFDMAVLRYRAMVHGIAAPWLYQSGDKWNNYTSRYSEDWHCDLADVLSDFGASVKLRLNEICAALSFPGKLGVDGSAVTELYDTGKIAAIRDYCETDVLNTYLVYLRYMLFKGKLEATHYNRAITDVVSLLENERGTRPHLGEFLDAWQSIGRPTFV